MMCLQKEATAAIAVSKRADRLQTQGWMSHVKLPITFSGRAHQSHPALFLFLFLFLQRSGLCCVAFTPWLWTPLPPHNYWAALPAKENLKLDCNSLKLLQGGERRHTTIVWDKTYFKREENENESVGRQRGCGDAIGSLPFGSLNCIFQILYYYDDVNRYLLYSE
jgi:hypothetical protein